MSVINMGQNLGPWVLSSGLQTVTALAKLMKQRAKMRARKTLDIWREGEILRVKLMIIILEETAKYQL